MRSKQVELERGTEKQIAARRAREAAAKEKKKLSRRAKIEKREAAARLESAQKKERAQVARAKREQEALEYAERVAKRKQAREENTLEKKYLREQNLKAWRPSIYPSDFAIAVLGESGLYPWQMECLEAISAGVPVSVCANNGSGKTAKVVACSVMWFLHEFPEGTVVITSGSARQLEKQLMPSLRLHSSKFPKWRFLNSNIITDEGGEAILFSTDDPGRAEGWHPKKSNTVDPIYIIVDEAKTVPDRVFEAFDRCTRRFQLFISTPGDASGQFYRSHRSEKALFWTKKVTSLDCPHIDRNKIERDRIKYGEGHPLFKSMHLAEFDENADALVLSPLALTEALKKQPEPDLLAYGGEVVAFADFAAGGDENVLAVRRGNKVRIVKSWHEVNTVQAVREFISLFRELSLHPGQVFGDAGGLGGPMLDLFAEEGFRVNRIHNVSPAREPESYANLGSESWFYTATEITSGRINLSDNEALEPQLFAQLTTRPRARDARQRLRTMPKDEMAKLGLTSPDRADALVGAIYCGSYLTGSIQAGTMRNEISMAKSDFSVPTHVF